jgi:poly(3-hydroxybutyrate) depolymerase
MLLTARTSSRFGVQFGRAAFVSRRMGTPCVHVARLLVLLVSVLAYLGPGAMARPTDGPPAAASAKVQWVTPEIKAPRVSFHTFESGSTKGKVSYHLYTPSAYDAESNKDRRLPVVYWLHGSGGGAAGIAKIAAHFDAAIEAGKTPPCLVVFVNGLVEGMYVDWKDGTAPLETVIIKDLVPHIDGAYRTIATREGRMLDGFSMGGYGAARLGFKFPDVFRAVSIVGAGPMQEELVQTPRAGRQRASEVLAKVYGGDQAYFRAVSPRSLAAQNAKAISAGSLIRVVIGDKDETFENNRLFHEYLDSLEIPHTWTVLPGVEHDPMGVFRAMGDENWTFHRAAFGEAAGGSSAERKSESVLSFNIKGQARRALMVNAPTDGTKRPVVLVLHGGMGNAEDMRRRTDFDALARKEGFMVVYAEGTDFGDGRHAWNTGHLLRRRVRDADDIAYFDTLIDTLVRDQGADPARVYMTGGSNGGMMTFVYAVARPQKLAAIAPIVASMFTFDTVPTVPLPILMINGGQDEEVPLDGGMSRNAVVRSAQSAPFKPVRDVVDFWVKANKSTPEGVTVASGTVTTTTYAAGQGGAVTEFVLDSAGGHGWPGSRARRGNNAPIASFSGAERAWAFFRDKSRSPDNQTPDDKQKQR